MPVAEADPGRPVYHFHSPAQWHNDPNGTIYYNGWHHLFYQLNPYGSEWGNMHWGHARSRDLVNWEHLPVALAPSKDKGENHVFSGGAILGPDGRPRVFYTSIGDRQPEQWLAEPVDDSLIEWKKFPGNPALSMRLHGSLAVNEWRDPFPFREGGETYIVCGGNQSLSGGQGSVFLYRASNKDLTEWKFLGPIFVHPDRAVWNIECPNLFRVGNKWMLIVSPHGPTQYFVGDLDLTRPRFIPERQGILDPGKSYASNISRTPDGRTLLWLWGRTETPAGKGWNSVMAIPRVLAINATGDPVQAPIAEIDTLRGEKIEVADLALTKDSRAVASGDCLDLSLEIEVTGNAPAGLRVRGTEIAYQPGNGSLKVGATTGFAGRGKTVKLRVLLDKRVVEVYANNGAAAIFETVDAWNGPAAVELFAQGEAKFRNIGLWRMKAAAMDLTRF